MNPLLIGVLVGVVHHVKFQQPYQAGILETLWGFGILIVAFVVYHVIAFPTGIIPFIKDFVLFDAAYVLLQFPRINLILDHHRPGIENNLQHLLSSSRNPNKVYLCCNRLDILERRSMGKTIRSNPQYASRARYNHSPKAVYWKATSYVSNPTKLSSVPPQH